MIKELFDKKQSDYPAKVCGWVRSVRNSKKFSFITMNDGSCFNSLQIVADADKENYQVIESLKTGAAMQFTGKIVTSQGKGQGIEMQAQSWELLGTSTEDYPLQKKATSREFLREMAHLRARSNTFGAVFRIRHVLAQATHRFFSDKGFYYLNSPIITGYDGEGAGAMFQVTTMDLNEPFRDNEGKLDFGKDYFGRQTHLCVTGQLEAEAFAQCMGSVYTFGPTFRAENSNTTRHLSEFWMIEPEVAFADLQEIAQLAADYIQYMLKDVLEKCADEVAFLAKANDENLVSTLEHVRDTTFKTVTYTDAINILLKSNKKFEFKVEWGVDLQTEHERYLTEEHFKAPIIVTDYPKDIKAFYMRLNDDGKTVRAMDVLVPGVGEIVGGSQREERYEVLKKKLLEHQLDEKDYWWYLDLRKYGSVVHSGFGLGFERILMYVTGMNNIRDVIPFPRTPLNADF